VSMLDSAVARYPQKSQELIDSIRSKIAATQVCSRSTEPLIVVVVVAAAAVVVRGD